MQVGEKIILDSHINMLHLCINRFKHYESPENQEKLLKIQGRLIEAGEILDKINIPELKRTG